MMHISQGAVDRYFELARKRYCIHLQKKAGGSRPYANDPIFNSFRFCNTHRELDKTTVWCKEHVRDRHPRDLLKTTLNVIAFRWFNRIKTGEKLETAGLFDFWDAHAAADVLDKVTPVVTGAYLIKTPNGMTKLAGVLWLIEATRAALPNMVARWAEDATPTLEAACYDLMRLPYMGGFMAHQVLADLKYTPVLGPATDRLTWAYPGPGTLRGVSRLLGLAPETLKDTSEDRRMALEVMRAVLEQSKHEAQWLPHWPTWEMSDISNWFCEFDKYCQAEEGGRMKRKYQPCT